MLNILSFFCIPLVFVTRYLDLLWNFHSMYLWTMKILYISISTYIVYTMKFNSSFSKTYEQKLDSFNLLYLLPSTFVLACFFNEEFTFVEVSPTSSLACLPLSDGSEQILWSWSYFLESVAIIPQLIMIRLYAEQNNGFVENITSHYVFTLGGYRVMYLLNWIYRFATEVDYWHPLIWVTGIIQTGIFSDFFYYYITSYFENKRMQIPVV